MNRFAVTVEDLDYNVRRKEVHRAENKLIAVLCHSLIGAEFEGMVDEDDLQKRCYDYGYRIQVLPL